jgi:Holliday junction resolvase RusA-like endonuclease
MQKRTIIVQGTPVSVNASSARKATWRRKIKKHARRCCSTRWKFKDLRVKVQFFHDGSRQQDTDNISKLVCDALQGIAYDNDSQIVERHAERKDIRGPYEIVGVNRKIIDAIVRGKEFIAITIERVGRGITSI